MTAVPATTTRETETDLSGTTYLQLIAFTLGSETYGVDIMAVREIRVWTDTTTLPNTPEYVMGVINLRGVIVPVFDLRLRFGRGATAPTEKHVIVVIAVGSRTIGILVDAVSDIINLTESDIRPAPDMELGQENAFLRGLATVNSTMIALIDPETLFNPEDVAAATGDQ